MKKFLLGIVGLAGVIAGAAIIWYVVIPFIGNVFNMMF